MSVGTTPKAMPLRMAAYQALRTKGTNVLRDPRVFLGVVLDNMEPDSQMARLLEYHCDQELLDIYVEAADARNTRAIEQAANRAAYLLSGDRSVKTEIAEQVACELAFALASVLHVECPESVRLTATRDMRPQQSAKQPGSSAGQRSGSGNMGSGVGSAGARAAGAGRATGSGSSGRATGSGGKETGSGSGGRAAGSGGRASAGGANVNGANVRAAGTGKGTGSGSGAKVAGVGTGSGSGGTATGSGSGSGGTATGSGSGGKVAGSGSSSGTSGTTTSSKSGANASTANANHALSEDRKTRLARIKAQGVGMGWYHCALWLCWIKAIGLIRDGAEVLGTIKPFSNGVDKAFDVIWVAAIAEIALAIYCFVAWSRLYHFRTKAGGTFALAAFLNAALPLLMVAGLSIYAELPVGVFDVLGEQQLAQVAVSAVACFVSVTYFDNREKFFTT